jgi:hypothetical protein
MTNVQLLFDLSKFERRITPSQQEFEEKNMELLLAFKGFVPQCFKEMHGILSIIEPTAQDKILPAVLMSGLLRGKFIKNYPENCRKATKKRFKLIGGNYEWLYVKKLDRRKRPSNIATKSSLLILNQRSTSKQDKSPNVFLGYTVSSDWSEYTGVYAVCIEGSEILWLSDISLLGGSSLTRNIEVTPNNPGPKLKDGIVKVKTKKGA